MADVRAPAPVPPSKLGKRTRGSKKETRVMLVGGVLDMAFTARKYTLGPGFEFWELSPDEKRDLAEKGAACLDALPGGQSNAVLAWILKQVEMVAPFAAFGMAGYSVVGWRYAMTKQIQQQQRAASARGVHVGEASGGNDGRTGDSAGTADSAGRGVSTETVGRAATGGEGVGTATATFGDVAGVFTPPAHLGS